MSGKLYLLMTLLLTAAILLSACGAPTPAPTEEQPAPTEEPAAGGNELEIFRR